MAAIAAAEADAYRALGWGEARLEEANARLAPIAPCFPEQPLETWIVEWVAARPELAEISGLREKLADAEKKLDGTGRVVLRYSGTEPVLRVMVEGVDAGLVDALAQGLADHLAEQIGRR